MSTEIIIPHDKIRDPQTITDVNREAFAEKGLDLLKNEATFEDDHDKGVRVMQVSNRKVFSVPDLSGIEGWNDED